MSLTPKLLEMLYCVSRWGGDGTIEMFVNFGEYEASEQESDDEQIAADWRLTQRVCCGLLRRLEKKGLIRLDADGRWELTEKGEETLKSSVVEKSR